jgi:uncharacterized cupin superfamily protein
MALSGGEGGVLELGVGGDLFSLPPGVETTWHVTTPFKEAWVLADQGPAALEVRWLPT